jgi:hypothetical protein
VDDLAVTPVATGGSTMKVKGLVGDRATVVQIERTLSDDQHSITGDGVRADKGAKGPLNLRFDETITVSPPSGLPTAPKPFKSRTAKAKAAAK